MDEDFYIEDHYKRNVVIVILIILLVINLIKKLKIV